MSSAAVSAAEARGVDNCISLVSPTPEARAIAALGPKHLVGQDAILLDKRQ